MASPSFSSSSSPARPSPSPTTRRSWCRAEYSTWASLPISRTWGLRHIREPVPRELAAPGGRGDRHAPPLPVPGVPPVCAPIPQQLKDNGDYFNDPIRAETFFPQAPQGAKYTNIPGATMASHIDAGGRKVESLGSLDGFGAAGVGVIANLNAKTTSTLTDTTGTGEATSEVA